MINERNPYMAMSQMSTDIRLRLGRGGPEPHPGDLAAPDRSRSNAEISDAVAAVVTFARDLSPEQLDVLRRGLDEQLAKPAGGDA